MNKNLRTYIIITVSILVGGGAFTIGALTAPNQQPTTPQHIATTPKPSTQPAAAKLQDELPAITDAILAAYPQIATDYTINKGQLYENGAWFGTTLTYKGSDTNNRDTLRILMQKKDGVWKLLTTPPVPLLSAKAFPDTPKSVLQAINKPISLPAGASNSPALTVAG